MPQALIRTTLPSWSARRWDFAKMSGVTKTGAGRSAGRGSGTAHAADQALERVPGQAEREDREAKADLPRVSSSR